LLSFYVLAYLKSHWQAWEVQTSGDSLKFFMNRNPYSCPVYNLGYRLLGVPVVGEKGNLSSLACCSRQNREGTWAGG